MTPKGRWSALTRPPPSCWPRPGHALPPRPGLLRREDYEYRREGTSATCSWPASRLAGWRQVEVTERRTMQDFAHRMRWLADEAYPEAQVVRVVLDNSEHPPHGVAVRDFPGS